MSSPSLRTELTAAYREDFKNLLLESYFATFDAEYLASPAGENDVDVHLQGRMLQVEELVLPWISEVFDLRGKRVLEIGTGTGSSCVPFARVASDVQTFEIAGASVTAAKGRAKLLGLENVRFDTLDPSWAQSPEGIDAFLERVEGPVHVIVLMAVLEHMLVSERLLALSALWKRLEPGGIVVVFETPNRIGWLDWHSVSMPFFHSLPDDLAMQYFGKTSRAHFALDPANPTESLYRLGRGVSYHEFELAIGFDALTVLNDGFAAPVAALRAPLARPEYDREILEIFATHLPTVPAGFSLASLDLVLLKGRDDAKRDHTSPRASLDRLRASAETSSRTADGPGADETTAYGWTKRRVARVRKVARNVWKRVKQDLVR